jgi:hypothetical protein
MALHSITSSARARIDGGMARPSALAVFMLTVRSILVGCSTGRSAGSAPHVESLTCGPTRSTVHESLLRVERRLSKRSNKKRAIRCRIARLAVVALKQKDQVMAFETLVRTLLILPPTLPIATIEATAIRDAISVYSMAVAPLVLFIKERMKVIMRQLLNVFDVH